MLNLLIINLKNNTWSELHIIKSKITGFTINNGALEKFNKNLFDTLNVFKISDNIRKLNQVEGYEVIYDIKNNYYHFFKNKKEDLQMFFLYNSTDALLYSASKGNKSFLRKFILASGITIYISFKIFTLFLTENNLIEQRTIELIPINDAFKNLVEISGSKYNSGMKIKFKTNITETDIKNAINESKYLTDSEKILLWKPELIKKVLPYYMNTNSEMITLIRHNNLKIIKFTGSENNDVNGLYYFDNNLHVRNKNDIQAIGHEYIHLLQVNAKYKFILEASAEIMCHEYFLNSSDLSYPFAYSEACRFLKILMEIIGPDIILEENFLINTTALSDAIKPYFTENEYNEFLSIMSSSPYYDKETLEQGRYDKLLELLKILYKNKIGGNLLENELIKAIYFNLDYNRVYFNNSLKNKDEYYTKIINTYEVEEAYNQNMITIYEKHVNTKEEFEKFNGIKTIETLEYLDNGVLVEKIIYFTLEKITYEEYKNNHFKIIYIVPSPGYTYNPIKQVVTTNERPTLKKIYIISYPKHVKNMSVKLYLEK